jgi:hypothetical protein
MDDPREELKQALIALSMDEISVRQTVEMLLAAGWTKRGVAQQAEPTAHSDELNLVHIKTLADIGRSTFSSAAMSFVLDCFFEAEELLEDAERRIEVVRNTAKAWEQHANTALAALSTQQPKLIVQGDQYGHIYTYAADGSAATVDGTPCTKQPPSEGAPAVQEQELSHEDACCLSLYFNRAASLANPQHARVNEWLKTKIAALRTQGGE